MHSAEKAIVAEYTDLNGVYYVKYEGDKNWTAMNSESIANPVLTGKSEPGVNVFVDHGTIAIEYFDNKNMFGNENVHTLNQEEVGKDFEMNSVSVFPNPTTEKMGMEFMLEKEGNVEIQIFDYSGKVVKRINSSNYKVGLNTLSIDVSDLPNSEYYVSLSVHDKKVTKFVYFK
ncbi:T9SS type A sorting domain-containing protein [bacterium]|nr:MAG: T9SS type A sorting domain-containing protein [bacterium]